MLSKEKTREILNSFSKECYDFWIREGNTKEEAYSNMISDIKSIKHDPYVPCGDLLDIETKEAFIDKLEERK